MGDYDVVYNAVTDYLSLFKDGATQALEGGTSLPQGKTTHDLTGWQGDNSMTIERAIYMVPRSSWFSNTHFDFHVTWDYGGRLNGRGRYVANAKMWVTMHSLTGTWTYDIRGRWENATLINSADPENPVAKLTGSITATAKHMTLHEWTRNWYISVKGDGSGRMYRM